jgi:winged helix DNA-binding protein
VAERLLAIQTQDLGAGMLSLRARVPGLTIPDVYRAIADRAVVVTWVNRGTIHLMRPDDMPWLLALTAPTQESGIVRRFNEHGFGMDTADRAVAVVERALADEGPLKREDLRDRVKAAGFMAEGRALVHLLFYASYRGLILRGPVVGRRHLFVRTADWLGKQPRVDREKALAELARRYLAGFGPATDADLAYWAGLPLRDARAGLSAIASELTQHDDGLVDLTRRAPAPAKLPQKLLPLWDDLLVGWKDKSALVGSDHLDRVFSGGMIGPAATRAGRVVGRWSSAGGKVVVESFTGTARGFQAEARDVERFLASRPF